MALGMEHSESSLPSRSLLFFLCATEPTFVLQLSLVIVLPLGIVSDTMRHNIRSAAERLIIRPPTKTYERIRNNTS